MFPHPSEAHLHRIGKKAKCNYYSSYMYSNFEIWHQICLWKKAWGYTLKYLWLQYFFLFIWKNLYITPFSPLDSDHTLQVKVETLAHFCWLFSAGSESKRHALQALGALQCITQCWKVNLTHFNAPCVSLWTKAPGQCQSVVWLAPNATKNMKNSDIFLRKSLVHWQQILCSSVCWWF